MFIPEIAHFACLFWAYLHKYPFTHILHGMLGRVSQFNGFLPATISCKSSMFTLAFLSEGSIHYKEEGRIDYHK